ncbi:MAGUK p55 subfamily member 5-A isoform X2 [Belonocnema kinseyi]|uniref:MAGUK p55 subfamily member 5-A isoform X2 n=1 Tax=Belonocnema kinseyi TaxID=2817044 RepID=UPI00143D11C9|nr:MAGUK p55 subfamily member 5-A isoform X2 [Belonocnema kinseyi]
MPENIRKGLLVKVNPPIRMSSFFRKISWCGCSALLRSGSESKNGDEEPVLQEIPKSSLHMIDQEEGGSHDLSMHFDLSNIKYIDEDDPDNDCQSNELDGPNAGNINDAWVIAVERGAKERLQKLSDFKRIQPRDITVLYQQISEGAASSSEGATEKDVSSSQITVTLSDKEPGTIAHPAKLSNGTVPKGIAKDFNEEDLKEAAKAPKDQKDALEKQQSCPDEPILLIPVQSSRFGERRASSPFQNGRTEVLIGESEGGPRSPRGSTSSAINDNNFLTTPEEKDYPEPICRSRRRSAGGVTEIHLQQNQQQQSQLQENNNSSSRDTKESREGLGPDEMWAPGVLGHHRELPVDVPDTLLQQAYPNKAGLNGVKPAIPPRDQKRAPARPPKDNLRLSTQNNNVEPICDIVNAEPTQQQLHSIRKYKEQLRRRKDEEEKQEYLTRSLRGSRKLQALESHATNLSGQENLAYSQDEVTTVGRAPVTPNHASQDVEEPPRPLTYGEVVASLERLQLQLRSISGALGISGPGVEAELEAVRTLLVQRRFATALSTHHALKSRLRAGKVLKTYSADASTLARDCVEVLEQWQSSTAAKATAAGETIAAAEELTALLTSYEMEGLFLAHDSIVSSVDGFQATNCSSSPSGPPSPSSSLRDSHVADNIKIIRIEKTNEPLGATVRNEGDAVIIGRVVRGGAADKSGLLHEGDEVLEVNGVEMRGKSVNEVCDILAGMLGSLTFLIFPAPVVQTNSNSSKREENQQIHHVRAHFDYDPEEDPYIPCRELGVSFQKGDVLHVISQEDPNWWQAYREGEEDQTLAGLIPSKAFQHQRESMKQTISGDKSTTRGSKKSSTLLCARKNPKKKKRNKFGANFNDDGYPLYATTTIDDYDSEEVLTYEEVALYYPRADHKRPIVLIGPPNIGRHELRQRLMQDSERFAAAIPHTSRIRKESEINGQDYHFISRSQFESDILCRKFVEHGEYEKAYYGTSVEAIRSVVNSGKICVLNLHPQSLKILRSSDLKPYVVFVAPPSLEKLRQKRIKNNENFKEDELKDIIEKAREMEDKYGHLFDMIIINNDTDRAYNQLLTEINSLEREPQWVPGSWLQ